MSISNHRFNDFRSFAVWWAQAARTHGLELKCRRVRCRVFQLQVFSFTWWKLSLMPCLSDFVSTRGWCTLRVLKRWWEAVATECADSHATGVVGPLSPASLAVALWGRGWWGWERYFHRQNFYLWCLTMDVNNLSCIIFIQQFKWYTSLGMNWHKWQWQNHEVFRYNEHHQLWWTYDSMYLASTLVVSKFWKLFNLPVPQGCPKFWEIFHHAVSLVFPETEWWGRMSLEISVDWLPQRRRSFMADTSIIARLRLAL